MTQLHYHMNSSESQISSLQRDRPTEFDWTALHSDTELDWKKKLIISVGQWTRLNRKFHHFTGILDSIDRDVSSL
jgi:hypothetical protein